MQPNILYSHLTLAAAMAYLLALLQKSERVPWIRQETAKVNAGVRAFLAAAVTLGISLTWAPSAGHTHTLTIVFPSAVDMAHGFFNWFGQYAMQHGWEKLFVIAPQQQPAVAVSNKFDTAAAPKP